MPAADLGPENPLPPLVSTQDLHATDAIPGIPAEMRRNMAYGHVPVILPYTLQDRYSRVRQPREFRVAVLENAILKATFLLEFGGRLWSLVHKPSGRELLDVNPVYQPANLAIRNAWFSGGVEWNIGITGHSPLTCSPLFAARVTTPDGIPVLRMYEWERIRQTPFQIDAYLPDGSPMLFLHFRIVNPHDHAVPMYWWSNIAIPETADTRVVVPAESAFQFDYETTLKTVPVPYNAGTDITYTTRSDQATDYFFLLPAGQRPWIAALDREGKGLIQVSTDLLTGRKLFLWGRGTGGQHWQEFLSVPGHTYLEIQAGLATTQLERLPMPAHTEWTWLEGYGLMEADAAAVHSADWSQARKAVESCLEAIMPRSTFDAEAQRSETFLNQPPDDLFQRGSGWGALERIRCASMRERDFAPGGLDFDDDSLGPAQQPWRTLLDTGRFPDTDPSSEPVGYLVQREWRPLLEKAMQTDPNWNGWYHLGVMYYADGDKDGARHAWQKSIEQHETPWALRNLAVLAHDKGRLEEAATIMLAAHWLSPSALPLIIETGQALIAAGRSNEWLGLLATLSDSHRANGRVLFLEAQAALATKDFDRVEKLLASRFVVETLRESESSLTRLWFDFQEAKLSAAENIPFDEQLRRRVRREFPLPPEYDFRMSHDDV